jgi:hypothetical protein
MVPNRSPASGESGMQQTHDTSPENEPTGRLWTVAVPLILGALYLFVGLFFRRPDMGDPDSYREAISAIRYINEGVYASYWDHPLTMLLFVAATRVAFAFEWNQLAVLNVLAVLLAATTVWPFYHLTRRLVSMPAAAFASVALVFSPSLISFTTYLSHEGVGFVFAIWSVYLFERALDTGGRKWALLFGMAFGATGAARPNAALFLALPLLILFLRYRPRREASTYGNLLLFAFLGLFGCLLPIFRPAIISRILSRSDKVFSAHYEIGWYIKSTTTIAVESLTPALVIVSVVGAILLMALRKRFVVLFAGVWILFTYLFYTGILCRHRYFLILVPPCILLTFAGSDQLDAAIKFGRERSLHIAKIAALLLLLVASLGPDLPELSYARQSEDAEIMGREIGRLVGSELLFTTSLRPIINYYNRESPPEMVYLITELEPGRRQMDMEAFQLALMRLRQGRPVFATGLIIAHFRRLNIDFDAEPVWEYKQWTLFRFTRLSLDGGGA